MINLKKVISMAVVTSCVMGFTAQIPKISLVADTNEPIKIMSVGDSITDGYWEQGGYRKYLYQSLTENGFNIDMVGDKGSNEETSNGISYDGNYCGYSGYAIKDIDGTEHRNGIYEVLVNGNLMEVCNPDIVLLQIGTNDILSAYNDGIIDRLDELVTYILSYMENTDNTLFVSTIPDIDVATVESWFWAYGDEKWNNSLDDFTKIVQNYIDSYNSQLESLVAKKQAEGCTNIQFADIHSVLDYQTDLYDGVHPSEEGYQKMGNYWSDVLTSYLNGENISNVTEETTTLESVTSSEETTTLESVTSSEETTTLESITSSEETTTLESITSSEETTILESTTSTEETITPESTTLIEETTILESITSENTTSTFESITSEIYDTNSCIPPIDNGELNGDGSIDTQDLLILKQYILGVNNIHIENVNNMDINNDNKVNVIDFILLKNKILKG